MPLLMNTWDYLTKIRGSCLHSPDRDTKTAPISCTIYNVLKVEPALCVGKGDAALAEPWIFARSTEGLSAKLASVVFLMWFVGLLMWTPLGIFSVSQARN